MTTTNENRQFGPLFWVVAAIALLWNAMGCINLVQQMSEAGRASLPPDYQDFIATRPTWAFIAFAVSVIAGVAGAGLMMLKSHSCVAAFIVSAIGALLTTLPALSTGLTSVIIGSAMSIILAAAFAWYASRKLR